MDRMTKGLMKGLAPALFSAGILFALFPGIAGAQPVEVLWLGQAATRITTVAGKVIVIDPFLKKNPKTPARYKDLKALGKVDLILLTHGHGDHIGDTVALAEMTGAKVALNADMGRTFASLGWLGYKQMVRFNKSGSIKPLGEGITITMVHAEHSSEVRVKGPEKGQESIHPGGEPSGYIIELENGYTVYHAGDTGVFGDMAFIGEYYKPDLTLLPIGGHFTMDPVHAAYAAKILLKSKTVIPIHYGTFAPLKGTPAQFKAALGTTAIKVLDVAPGQAVTF